MREKITTSEAAYIMATSAAFVRVAMQQEKLPIGTAIQMPGSKNWSYNIVPKKLAERQGITMEELEQQLKEVRG